MTNMPIPCGSTAARGGIAEPGRPKSGDREVFAQAPDCTPRSSMRQYPRRAQRSLHGALRDWRTPTRCQRNRGRNKRQSRRIDGTLHARAGQAAGIRRDGGASAAWWCLGAASLAPESKLIEDTAERRIEQRRQRSASLPPSYRGISRAARLPEDRVGPGCGCTLVVKPSPYTPSRCCGSPN